MELTREITDLYSTWVWVRVRKSFITSTSWVRVWFGARSTIWSTSSCSRKFYNLGARLNIVSDFFSNTESKYLPRISQSCINILVHLIRPGNWRFLKIRNPLSVTCICNITRIKALGPIYLSEITLNYKRYLKNNGPVISPNCRAWRPFLIQKFILLCNFFFNRTFQDISFVVRNGNLPCRRTREGLTVKI